MRILKESFNAGEFTKRLYSRYELEKYKNGCKTLTNMISLPHGPVTRRPGTKYVAAVKTASRFTRLISFQFSEDDSYIIEFGHEYCRFYRRGGIVQGADADTVLLLHNDGINNSVTIPDDGHTGHTITAAGNAKLKTGSKKFGTASCYFDGNGDYISLPDHADFNFAGDEFTIDCWVYPTVGVHPIYFQGDAASVHDHIALFVDTTSDTVYISVFDGGARTLFEKAENVGVTINSWNHIAVVRGWGSVTDDWAICVNGAAIATFTDSLTMPDHDQAIKIGVCQDTTHTVDFGNTGHAITFGNDAVFTAVSKFGNWGIYFDGTNDYLSAADHADWDITTNWTVDLFVKHASHSGTDAYICQNEDQDNYWMLKHEGGSGLRFKIRSGGNNTLTTPYAGEIEDTDWHHIAVVKIGTEYGVYKDGAQISYLDDASTDTFAGLLYIGNRGTSNNSFEGSMNNIRVQASNVFSAAPSAGLGDSITVPTAYHVPDSNTKLLLFCDGIYSKLYVDEYRVSTKERWTADFSPPSSPFPGGDNSGSTYEVATTYIEEDLPALQFVQSADTMYIVHKKYVVRKLVRSGYATWAISNVSFTNQPSAWGAANYPRTVEFYEDRLCFGGSPDQPDTIWMSDSGDYVTFTGEVSITAATIAFVNSNPDTITDSGSGFVTAGFLAGQDITVKDSTSNNGTYTITNVAAGTITLISTDALTVEGAGATVTIDAGTAADDESITLTLLSRRVNDIAWLAAGRRLLVGTVGEEWWVAGPSDTEPITPANNIAKRDSAWGSEPLMPVNIGDTIFYLQQNGKILRELIYDFNQDKYMSADMSVLAEHLTRDYSITAMAYQQHPYQILWCVRSDGTVLALTYLKEHKVVGWSTHNIGGGEVESVAVIPGDPEDEVWFVVKRTINSAVVRYVEKMNNFNYGSALEDAFFVDCGLTYDGAAATTISGLSHLEGEVVTVLAYGQVDTGQTVSSSAITLTDAASKVHVGLSNTPVIETLDAVTEDNNGTLQGAIKRIENIAIRLIDSMGGLFGPGSSSTDPIIYRDETVPFTGWTRDLSFGEGNDKTATVYITSDEPYPLEVAAIRIDLEDE